MVATSYATPPDVATLLKVTFDEADNAQCEMVLAGVTAIMRSRLPDLDTWINEGLTDPALAKFAACSMAKSCIDVTTSRGVKQEVHPEYSITFQDITESNVDLSDMWIDLLTPPANRARRGKAFSIRPGHDGPLQPWRYECPQSW